MESSAQHLIEHWNEEQRSAYLYRICADSESGSARATLFSRLADEAIAQAKIWEEALARAGAGTPQFVPDMRARLVGSLVRVLGPRRMRGALAAMKVRGMGVYSLSHPGHSTPAADSAPEGRHRSLSSGANLRAGVFGVNDGLVSNAGLIFGVAGATSDPRLILLTGIAGVVAGSLSMAAGEYVSVRSQRELYEYQIALEREELEHYPDAEAQELAIIYEAKGLPPPEAETLARRLIADPAHALDTLSREELGLNPAELGSPLGAATSSLASFAVGGLVPLLPFIFARGDQALVASVALTAVALFAVGALLSLFTGRAALRSGLRMLLIGTIAGLITHGIGRLAGTALG